MRLILILLTITFNVYAGDPDMDRALKHTQKAIMAYPEVKKLRKAATKKIKRYIPKSKVLNTTAAVGFYALTQGKVSTHKIKKMDAKVFGGRLRPDVVYNFREKNINTTVNIKWSW